MHVGPHARVCRFPAEPGTLPGAGLSVPGPGPLPAALPLPDGYILGREHFHRIAPLAHFCINCFSLPPAAAVVVFQSRRAAASTAIRLPCGNRSTTWRGIRDNGV